MFPAQTKKYYTKSLTAQSRKLSQRDVLYKSSALKGEVRKLMKKVSVYIKIGVAKRREEGEELVN